MKKFFNFTNILFVLILLAELIPARRAEANPRYYIGLVLCMQVLYLLSIFVKKDSEKVRTAGDVMAILYILLLGWELVTSKFNVLDKMLFPTPGLIVSLFIKDMPELLKGLLSSLQLLASGYFLALATAIPLALFIGWRERLYKAVSPLTKILGPIPPIVYIPYAIGLLPTFKVSSIFIIYIGAFWPIFMNSLTGVFNVERKLIDSAKVLNVKESTMLFKIILPGALPSIISGATLGLVLSFIVLTAAEMIGATSGLGWYVKYFSDFADYPRVIVGIIFIGIVITVITYFFDKVEKYLLRWKN